MKNYFLISAFCALSLSATAQTLPTIGTVTIQGSQLTLQGHIKTRYMDNNDFYRFIGSYDLANGQTLSLYTRGFQKYAAVEGSARHEIHATSANSFVADDRKLAVQINFDDNGAASGYAILAPASNTIAGNAPISSETALAFK